MSIAIPIPSGVPYLNGSPKFWKTAATSTPSFDTQIQDPRWTGSYAFGYGDGAGPLALLRVAWFAEDGEEFLLLSWDCRVDPLADTDDQLWIGLGTKHGELFIKIEMDSKGEVISCPQTYENPQTHEIETVWKASVHGRGSNGKVNPAVTLGATPTWILDNTRVWRAEKGVTPHINYPWAVHMRIPIKAGATSLTDKNGVAIDKTKFWMWIYGEQWSNPDPDTGAPMDLTPFQWPPVYSSPDVLKAPYDEEFNFKPPPIGSWNELSLVTSSSGAGGVAIEYGNFGTRNPGSTNKFEFRRKFNNTFFAKPVSYDSTKAVPARSIGAKFRLANWGSTIGAGGSWEALPVTYVDANAKDTNRGELKPGGILPDDDHDIEVQWDSSAWENDFADGSKTEHQCMAVDLDVRGGGVALSVASAYQNMNFVTNSVQIQQAEINLKAAKTPVEWAHLFIELVGMTEGAYTWSASAERAVAANPHDKALAAVVQQLQPILGPSATGENIEAQVAAVLANVDMRIVQKLIPHIKVHVSYPTGQRVRRDGRMCDVYTPATSYGLFGLARHTEGWRAAFDDTLRINKNLYKLPMPGDTQKAYVPTKLQGLHKGEPPLVLDRVWKYRNPKFGPDLLGELLDKLDIMKRNQRRVSDRIHVLEEVGRRAKVLEERLGKVAWATEAKEVLTEVREYGLAARETAASLTHHQQQTAVLEHKVTLLHSYIDAAGMHEGHDLKTRVRKAFRAHERAFPQIIKTEQRALLAAWKLAPLIDAGMESLREVETLLSRVDDDAGLLRRIGDDFDRRSPFDLDDDDEVEIPAIRRESDRRAPASKRARFGAAGTLQRSMKQLPSLADALKKVRERLGSIDETQREMGEIVKDLSSLDEPVVRRLTSRLRRKYT